MPRSKSPALRKKAANAENKNKTRTYNKKQQFKAPGVDESERLSWYARTPIGFLCAHLLTVFANFVTVREPEWGPTIVLFVVFGVLPLIDYFLPLDETNPTPAESRTLNNKRAFRWITWSWVPWECFLLVRGSARIVAQWDTMSGLVYFTYVVVHAIGMGGIGITIAHELIHKSSRFENFLGRILLAFTCYGHWEVEHLYGHHKFVGTPGDPATSLKNQSFYSFLPQTVIGTLRSSLKLEKKRLSRARHSFWSHHNTILMSWAASAALASSIYTYFGWPALRFFFDVSLGGIIMLELVNYVEHYGLKRESTGKGKFEQVTPAHSWNTAHVFSNFLLFKLQRHSDHHAFAGRRYQVLRSFVNSPHMPNGYPLMILVALCPPLWFSVMNSRLERYHDQLDKWQKQGYTMDDLFPQK